ncbi:MAG TPA: chondroitinase-B domain-containing protein [Alphaproteobacteria bacterium]|nr:chondroitinase-B domain-containing protein [Alphaproteobacteria bacterium]
MRKLVSAMGRHWRLVSSVAILMLALTGGHALAEGRFVPIASAAELARAIERAEPGDVLALAPGTYRVRRMDVTRPGTRKQPITLRGAPGAVLETTAVETFWVAAPYWIFEDLTIIGVCKLDDYCEHAFHIVGGGDHTVVRRSRMIDFNAMIKGNGRTGPDGETRFPDHVRIEDNYLYNRDVRDTDNAVTLIDVLGTTDWLVRGNFLADFGKGRGNGISYAAFFKGNGHDNRFEENLVICNWRHRGGVRVGLSFGGGGATSPRYCRDGDCSVMETGGVMANNIVMNCNEVGIYLNRAGSTRILHNLLYGTAGIDVRYPESTAIIRNNILSGAIRERDGGSAIADGNIETGTWIAPWLPAAKRRIEAHLRDIPKKYPNWVPDGGLAVALSAMDHAFAFLDSSVAGNGMNALRDLYVDADNADFSLWKDDEVRGRAVPAEGIGRDFCGNPRGAMPHDLGPIEYDTADCPRLREVTGSLTN